MAFPYPRVQVESPGNIIFSANYNAENDNHITNNIPTSIDDYSSNASQSNSKSDPGVIGAENLPVTLADELTQMRYVVGRIIGGVTGGHRDVPSVSLSTIIKAASTQLGKISNLGLSLAAGILTIKGSDGTALSATNFGEITVPSTIASGQYVTLQATANATLQDDTASPSYLTNLEFGITATTNWANDMPFFLYVVNRADSNITAADGTSKFFLSRNPTLLSTPSSANDIGDSGNIPVNDTQDVILILADVTIANYTSLPCQLIGAIRMTYLASSHDWTISALGNSDGIGQQQLARTFSTAWTMPLAQNGAATGTYFKANGGTAPLWTINEYKYIISQDRKIWCHINISGDGGADGAGAVTALVAIPTTSKNGFSNACTVGVAYVNSAGTAQDIDAVRIGAASTDFSLKDESGGVVTNSNFSSGNRELETSFTYIGF